MELQKKVITIQEATPEQKGEKVRIKIKGDDNLTYSVWKTKQDGSVSVAYTQISGVELMGVGKTFSIAYDEKQGDYQGKPVTYRTIRSFEPASKPQQAVQAARPTQQRNSGTQPNWDEISWGKCKHAYLVEAFKMLLKQPSDTFPSLEKVKELEKNAEAWADMSMRRMPKEQERPDGPPAWQDPTEPTYPEDDNDIPF